MQRRTRMFVEAVTAHRNRTPETIGAGRAALEHHTRARSTVNVPFKGSMKPSGPFLQRLDRGVRVAVPICWGSCTRRCAMVRRAPRTRPREVDPMSTDTAADRLRARVSRQGEDALGRLAQELLESPFVSGAISRAFEAREKAAQAQEVAMGALNLPSAGDLERLTRRVRSVSQRLEGVEDALDRIDERFGAMGGAGLGSLEPRLNAIESQLSALAGQLADVAGQLGR